MKPNLDIRKLIRDSNVFNWEVANQLGIGENTFYRLLRKELTDEEKAQVLAAVESIKEKKQMEVNVAEDQVGTY